MRATEIAHEAQSMVTAVASSEPFESRLIVHADCPETQEHNPNMKENTLANETESMPTTVAVNSKIETFITHGDQRRLTPMKTIIHIDETEVLVPKKGIYELNNLSACNPESYSDNDATINVTWWNCEDEIAYVNQLKHPIEKLRDLLPHTVGKVHRAPAEDWWEFGFTLSPEYAFQLLKQRGSVPAGAELFDPPWRTETHPYCTGSFHEEDCIECL
jgi:hypothetical protein